MWLLADPAPYSETHLLAAGTVRRFDARHGVELRCLAGSVWATAGAEDVLLEVGQSRRFRSRFALVVQALGSAQVSVSELE